MENGKKIALGVTVVVILAVGIRLGLIYKQRKDAENAPVAKQELNWTVTDDDMVHLKHIYPSTMKDAKDLKGKRVWISAGGQQQYFPYEGGRVNFAKPAGTLLGAQALDIKDAIQQKAPSNRLLRIPEGDTAMLMVFTLPDDKKEYAAVMGYVENGQITFYLDEMLFYDDPHTLYKHWGAENWAAIDKHEPKLGMSENMMMLALGQVSSSGSQKKGDRTVRYFNIDKPFDVTFEHDKATKIEPVKP